VFEFSRRQLNTPIIIESKQCKQHFKIDPFEPFVLHDCIFGNIIFNLGLEFVTFVGTSYNVPTIVHISKWITIAGKTKQWFLKFAL
jgi:hypothetical protein